MATFNGTNSNNTIVGSNDPDIVDGRAGNDLIFGYGDGSGVGGTPPVIDPAGGGGADSDSLLGANGNDTVHAGGGADTLDGGAGLDSLNGGAGDDTLIGGAANDTMDGSEGSDTYWIAGTGNGADVYADSGAAGEDRILAASDNTKILLSSGFGPGSGIEQISANGFSDVSVYGTSGDDLLDFSATTLHGLTWINGGLGNDTIIGSAGSELVFGGVGSDSLVGGDGSDYLAGGAGDNTMVGGAGDDTLESLDGNDTFLVGGTGDGIDRINDYGILEDFDRILATEAGTQIGLASGSRSS
jgi:Ca2+-binding RTX toxin-like protein